MKTRKAVAPVLALVATLSVAWAATSSAEPIAAAAAPAPAAVKAAVTSLRVEPLGDSITNGYQSTTGNGYRGPLYNELQAEGYPLDFVGSVRAGTMSDPDNEGHNGWRIDQIASIADSTLATYKPNVITLMMGTNDLGQNYQVSTAPARLKALVDQIMTDDPTATLLVANLIVSTNTVVAPAEPAYNATIPPLVSAEQAEGRHVGFVDMHSALTTADMFDALHPNDGGYQKMADAWNKGIQAAAAAGWITPPAGGAGGTGGTGGTGPVSSGIGGKCVDDYAGGSANGTVVDLWDCNNTPAQQWTPSGGTLKINGKCLDVTGGATANGSAVELWDCNGGGNQVWNAQNGELVNPASGRCLDDPGFNANNATALDLWDCNGGTNQKWAPAA